MDTHNGESPETPRENFNSYVVLLYDHEPNRSSKFGVGARDTNFCCISDVVVSWAMLVLQQLPVFFFITHILITSHSVE